MHPNNDEDMLEVRANGLGGEGVSTRLLEHDGHYVVPDVALPQQLVIRKQHSLNCLLNHILHGFLWCVQTKEFSISWPTNNGIP